MNARELRDWLYDALVEKFGDVEPGTFVGLQGDAVIVIQLGGDHLAVQVVPVQLGVAS